MNGTYESTLELIAGVPSAIAVDIRDIRWLTAKKVVGISRDHGGKVEVFLNGSELRPLSSVVHQAMEFREWHRTPDDPIKANRLVFPPYGHFDQVAAFICTELLRAGADVSLTRAFASAEPLVELAIERLLVSHSTILGLAGELLFLDALSRQVPDSRVGKVVDSWQGWKRSSRDFVWGSAGVEVKTTTGNNSSHIVQGVHQIEPGEGLGSSTPEDKLYLVSIGLHSADTDGDSFTIPQLVDRTIARLTRCGFQDEVDKFVMKISEYGLGEGYVHSEVPLNSPFATPYFASFVRAYDMADTAIEVLRREDLRARRHVDVNYLKFRVDLPNSAGLMNPVVGLNRAAQTILGGGL